MAGDCRRLQEVSREEKRRVQEVAGDCKRFQEKLIV